MLTSFAANAYYVILCTQKQIIKESFPMRIIGIAVLVAACLGFWFFEHNAPHHKPITKNSSQQDKEDKNVNQWRQF
jgi:UDP-N-acetylmuramyl pentapeptide phosphotransferase/UDP-N-acetylglucosamine-1-phosphate transferase